MEFEDVIILMRGLHESGPGPYPARHMGHDFSNGPVKREMSFLTPGFGYKKKEIRIILRVSLS